MKLSNVVLLYGTRLRARLGQELLALVGIAVGVSLLFAALVANASLTSSFDRTVGGLVGDARWQLSAGSGVSEKLVKDVRATPGIAAAAPVFEARTEVYGPNGQRSIVLFGVTEQFARINGRGTQRFSADYLAAQRAVALPGPLAADLGLSLGQLVELSIGGRRVRARLGAMLQRDQIGDLVDTPLGLAPLRYLQTLAGAPGRVTRVLVVPRSGGGAEVEERLERVAEGRASVRPARFEGDVFRQASQPTSQSTAMFSVFSALVGFLFAFSAVLLTVPDRRRLIADLHLEGYTPRTVAKVMLVDALALGILGSALGIAIGDQISRQLFSETPSFLELAFTFDSQTTVTLRNVAIAAFGGIAASCIAVFAPTASSIVRTRRWSAARDQPVAGRARRADWLLVSGLVCLLGGLAIVATSPSSAAMGIAGLALLTVGMLFVLPTILTVAVAGLTRATFGLRTVVPFLASVDLRDHTTRARALAVSATGAVAVFGSVALQGAHSDLQRGLDRTTGDLVSVGDLWAMAPGRANLLATIPFDAPMRGRNPPGIRAITDFRASFLDIGDRRVWVIGAPATARHPVARHQTLDGDDRLVTARIRAGGWAVLSAGLANDLGVEAGEDFTLPSPVPMRVRVAALSTNMGWPPGSIVLNADDYATAWGAEDVSALTATLSPGSSPSEGKRAFADALGAETGLVVRTATERADAFRAGSRQGLERLTQIAALVLAAAMIAMAAAMAGLIWQRRSFYAAVKVEGYGIQVIWRSLLVESAVLVSVGCIVGASFGLLGQRLLSRALTDVTGFPVAYSLAAVPAIVSCLAVVLVCVGIIGGFGYYVARVASQDRVRE